MSAAERYRVEASRVEEVDEDGEVVGAFFGARRPPKAETVAITRYASGTIAVIQLGKRTIVRG